MLCSPWRTLHGPSHDKRWYAPKYPVCFEPSAQLSVTSYAIRITATWPVSYVHIMFPLAFSEWKSRTELAEAAYVKWAQLREHSLLEKYKSIKLKIYQIIALKPEGLCKWLLFIFMLLSALLHAWRWQHLSSKKLSPSLSIRPSLF